MMDATSIAVLALSGPLISAYEAEDLKAAMGWVVYLRSICWNYAHSFKVHQSGEQRSKAMDDNQELHRKVHQLQARTSKAIGPHVIMQRCKVAMAKLKAENSSLKKARGTTARNTGSPCSSAAAEVNRRLKGLLVGSEPEPYK